MICFQSSLVLSQYKKIRWSKNQKDRKSIVLIENTSATGHAGQCGVQFAANLKEKGWPKIGVHTVPNYSPRG